VPDNGPKSAQGTVIRFEFEIFEISDLQSANVLRNDNRFTMIPIGTQAAKISVRTLIWNVFPLKARCIMSQGLSKQSSRGLRGFDGRDPFTALREGMEGLLSGFFGDGGEEWFGGRFGPSVDLSETENELEMRIDLPGVKPEEIDIQLAGDTLTIRGERKEEHEDKGRAYHRVERRSGSFSRSVRLPCEVQPDGINAQFHDGVLTISLPKCETAKAQKINVKSE